MMTCQKKKGAFACEMGTVLDFEKGSPMMKAMGELEYDSIEDIVNMDKEEVMRLLYTVKETKQDKSVEVTIDVSMKLKKKLLHVLWWCSYEVLFRASKHVTTEDWLGLTEDTFDVFVDIIAVNMARTVVETDPDGASTLIVKQVNDFQRGHKRDLT
eukprot:10144048-Ditylum_brightwellii.AAC.1